MTLLSITASFGALVFIFQEGNFSNILGLHDARVHDRRQPDHHVQRPVRAVDGLRGPAAVADPGGVPPDRRQHRVGRRGPGQDRRRHHRRGADHGHGLLGLRPGRVDHDQEHRRGHGDRRPHRRDDRPDPARAGHDAAAWASGTGGRPGRSGGSPTGSGSATPRTSSTLRPVRPRRRRPQARQACPRHRRSRRLAGDGDPHPTARREPLRRQLLRVALGQRRAAPAGPAVDRHLPRRVRRPAPPRAGAAAVPRPRQYR